MRISIPNMSLPVTEVVYSETPPFVDVFDDVELVGRVGDGYSMVGKVAIDSQGQRWFWIQLDVTQERAWLLDNGTGRVVDIFSFKARRFHFANEKAPK